MTHDRDARDPERAWLDALAPSRGWLARLPAIGREAASRFERPGAWSASVTRTGRWFLPLAAGLAAVCWLVSARVERSGPTGSVLLLSSSDPEIVAGFSLEARR